MGLFYNCINPRITWIGAYLIANEFYYIRVLILSLIFLPTRNMVRLWVRYLFFFVQETQHKQLANSLSSEGFEQELIMKISATEKTRKNLKH